MGKDLNGKELGAGFSQRKNKSYCARYNNRFGERKTIYDKDLRLLKKRLTEALYEDDNLLNIVDSKVTLDQWYTKWMLVYKNDTIRSNTKRHYNHVYSKHISPELGIIPICEMTQLQVKALLNKIKSDGYGWETQNKVRILLVDMFNRALEDNFVKRNPSKGVRLSSVKPKEERRILTREEQTLFFECCSGTFYDNLFVVAVNTGLRPGELFALTWKDIDLTNKTISVNKTLVYQKFDGDTKKEFHMELPKTFTSTRCVPINKICERALKKQYIQKKIIERRNIKTTQFPELLFTTRYNTPLNSVLYSESICKHLKEINLTRDDLEQFDAFSGHTFRHTFATRCIEAGVKPKTLQKYLGHASLQMTMDLYVHVTDDSKRMEMELLENELSKLEISDEVVDEKYNNLIKKDRKVVGFSGVQMA